MKKYFLSVIFLLSRYHKEIVPFKNLLSRNKKILLCEGYSINGESNGFEYNSNIINSAYVPSKESHRENMDFYGGANSGHSLASSRSQTNHEESLRSSSYTGFSPSSHNAGFPSSYTTTATRENLASFPSSAAQSSFDNYNSNSNGDSTFEAYTQGSDQVASDFDQLSGTNKHKNLSYMRFSDNVPGATNTGNYPELGTEASTYRGDYSGDPFRGQTSQSAGFMDSVDPTFNREVSNLFGSTNGDYSYGKHKENAFGIGGSSSSKFVNEIYSTHPETRYVRGSHGSMSRDYPSSMFLSNSGSSPFSNVRGAAAAAYGSGKYKYNKYLGDYTSTAGLNYLSKEQDIDYLLNNYGKSGGKLATIKEVRPSSITSQVYPGPSYLSKVVGGYKSKPSIMNLYHSSSPIGYSSMSGLHSSFSGNSYADGPLLRRYRSSSSYVPGHASTYSGYY
ncbi:hypothetical protein K0M31_018800 [Melipona bicolor]|uniref:Uncharacterized protein n=1 Tax=Melipona bicolor TaxID=60889 RepID=A0AA40G425_9HYME|nr:hypothetical protein K0M31_018800 [Melipona bicolor]